MPNNGYGLRGRRPRRHRGKSAGARRFGSGRTTRTRVLLYTKNLTFKPFYDNNGTDEQGLKTVVPLNLMLPASSSQYANDYNRSATLHSIKITIRWTNGLTNPPWDFQGNWVWPQDGKDTTYRGPVRRLNNVNCVSVLCTAPRQLQAINIDNPSNETAIRLELQFYGIDMKGTDIPGMEFEVCMLQEPAPLNAHSGK